MTADTSIEPQRFRDLMAAVCTPVTVVTTRDDDRPHGATVSSFGSLSLEPPLITIAFDHRSAMLAHIQAVGKFGMNLLGHNQDELAMLFAQRDADRFADTAWHHDHELPRLDGAAGWLVCELYDSVAGGDHQLLFGRVTAHRTFGTHSRYDERPRALIVDQIAACAR